MQSNIIIIGKNSFIGQNIISNLKNYNFTEIDLVGTEVCKIDFTKAETVIHLAAIVHQKKLITEESYFKINRDLAYSVAKRAKEQGVKQFIFMSSAKVYGESNKMERYWNEESECKPTDPYGKSKFEAENLIKGLEDKAFKVVVVRSPLVYGAGVKANMFNLIKLVDHFPLLPFGNMDNKRSIVYIGNLVSLLNRIIELEISGVFIAGDKFPLSTTQIVQMIALGFNKRMLLFTVPKPILSIMEKIFPSITNRLYGSLVIDNSKTNFILNFEHPYTSEQGICEMVSWYKTRNSK